MFAFKRDKVGPLKCVDIRTGEIRWSQAGFGQGNAIVVGETVLALTDQGDLVRVDATPEAYRETGRTKAVEDKCWSTPACGDGRIYVRSTAEAVCLAP